MGAWRTAARAQDSVHHGVDSSRAPDRAEVLIAHETLGQPVEAAPVRLVWAHGWGQNREAFRPLVEPLKGRASHLLVDLPGFGASKPPPADWGTAHYADAMAAFLKASPAPGKTIWIGHSFGCRVGLQIAARHPELIDGLFLIAAAGLKRRRSLAGRIKLAARIYAFKAARRAAPLFGLDVERLRGRFGSADYASAGAMRPILARVVAEDLSEEARQVRCPTWLIYGEDDRETPPEIGERLAKLVPGAQLSILPHQDHYSVLGSGRHQILKRLRALMEAVQ